MSKQLSIIIINYNQKNLLKQCWQNILDANLSLDFEVIFVDNHSIDGGREMLNEFFDKDIAIKKIINAKNFGFAKAVNQGIGESSGQYILVLNPDIIVLPGAIESLCQFMNNNQRCAIAGPQLLNPDKTVQFSVYQFPKWYTPVLRRTFLKRFSWAKKHLTQYLLQDWGHQENRLVDWLLGGAMMLRREALDEVGLLDERFFLYFEDVELCRRARQKGWQVWYVAQAQMYHFHQRLSAEHQGLFNKTTWIHFISAIKYFLFRK